MNYFKTENYAVGYDGNVLIDNINIAVGQGEILCLIGPNGSGKSTILKSITQQLTAIHGSVYIDNQNIGRLSARELAKRISVMLTDRMAPELTTCEEVVRIGRYPYTNVFGALSEEDHSIVAESMRMVRAYELKDRFFDTLSDGQKQRVLLAKALCQQPQVLILDEPTSFLDIRHKIELMMILRKLAVEQKLTVVLSLHEIDLAAKLADTIVLVNGDRIERCGMPEDVLNDSMISELYGLRTGHFDTMTGSVEMPGTKGKEKVFVAAGNGCGTRVFRALQKKGIPFSTGILMKCDMDYRVAADLSTKVFCSEPFEPPEQKMIEEARRSLAAVDCVIDAGTPGGRYNQETLDLIRHAVERKIKVLTLREKSALPFTGMTYVSSVEELMQKLMKLVEHC